MRTKTNYKYLKKWREKILQNLKNAFGAKCGICGYMACLQALEFHHLNKEEKSFNVSSWRVATNTKALMTEVQKCVLLCCRCHREVHAGVTKIAEDIVRFDHSLFPKNSRPKDEYDACPVCNKNKLTRYKFCSQKCACKRRSQKIQWSLFDLEQMILAEGSVEAVARKLGVSGNAVRKQVKKLRAVSPHPDKVSKG